MKDKAITKKLVDMLRNRENIERIRFIRLYKIGKFWIVVHTDEVYYPESDDDGIIASSEPNGYVPF